MFAFWIAAAVLSAAAAGLVLARGKRAAAPGEDPALAVHRRQLAEIDDLAERGLLAEGELKAARAKYPLVEHPVVRVHPVTGKKILYVNSTFTSHIKGLSRSASDALLTQLLELARVPEFQARLRWAPGTLAVWDNRSTQHYAVGDFFPQHRKLHRITITTDQTF